MRPSKAAVFLEMARSLAKLSTCPRRQVGCIFTDVHGRIISSGYNGVPPKMPHCIDQPCPGADLPSGVGLDKCMAVHAEMNAMALCHDVKQVDGIYVTCSPCIHCVKSLLTTSAKFLTFTELYVDDSAKALWLGSGRAWCHVPA